MIVLNELIREYIFGRNIDDVILTGFVIEGDESGEFIPDLGSVFFQAGGRLFACESVRQFSALRLTFPEELFYNKVDDDVRYGKISVRNIIGIVDHSVNNIVREFRIFNPEECNDDIICGALLFIFNDGRKLFLDPSWHFGIRIGGSEAYEEWLINKYSAGGGRLNINVIEK